MPKLPKTEKELTELIEEKVNEATEKLTSEHNGIMANLRKKHDADLKKVKEQASLTAEELAKEKLKEQQEADRVALEELRSYKKTNELTKRLVKEGLPEFFVNDARLLGAEEGDLNKVIREVKKDYDANFPKGNQHSTVTQVNVGGATQKADDKQAMFDEVGQSIAQILGK